MSYSRNEIAINLTQVKYITRVAGDPNRTRFHFSEHSILVEVPYTEVVQALQDTLNAFLNSGRPIL